ncbi:hypothetical protein IHV25_07945 [Phaeovibrio sulfidiphilus]|uniref:Cyclophilin-like domain-containing protein n=2 Tax=Phaeovibrio sulfidiphilus TaxID=1220600 RepID=A0A8J7CD89_9PROT|nr:hypothetical protein [Phaeovibrio sulfidiphilus]
MTVGGHRFSVTLADTDAARAFEALVPLVLKTRDLNRNEKYGDLPRALPRADHRPGQIETGDLMLWDGGTLVLFYRTFESTWPYTRLGRVDDPAALEQVLGGGAVRLEFQRK